MTTTVFTETVYERARAILARYPEGRERSALLPLLHLVQSEEGYVSPAGVAFCAEVLGINKAQVGAVATFYTMYKRRPTGDWLVSVCTNTMCDVLGGQQVYETLSELLGVGHDETTADGRITLEHAECLAACDYGPVMTVNYDFFDNVTPDSAVEVVEALRAGTPPKPSRAPRLCTLKEMAVQLAGFSDPREGAVGEGVAGAPTLRGVTLAQQHGIAVHGFDPDTPIPRKDADGTPARSVPAKVADAVKSVPAKVASAATAAKDAVTHRKPSESSGGDVKDPEVRAAEARNPDARTPEPDASGRTAPGNTGDAAGDAKPAGDDPGPQRQNLKDAQ
ncbi:NADH-quinone oxidoreductase subunit NuoE [Catenuloplanes atrovinosus]|uniref:NADH-quinone oxidoreductase subunit E n=1 Tax=Catenuloplanes atrovinosus TaxID=137266 RepID=A0AAE4CD04_9ACTN|nr:NADH-quinone oxidoreductase subunit NuoE [Catenuloplanes atrovinosus]MDR7279703.1 NADH-quinone oxidoreductase subunit E [Catenuloplanes atrovinosus]